ncbi:hypothetical protein DRN69_00610 [Candidatus Pacearchaeota archaeon]|nr:MAG: hypothetical protein DRN69_00610 [Candidatus Pacearchaeota archaeon]
MNLTLIELLIVLLGLKVFCFGCIITYLFQKVRILEKNAIQMPIEELTMKVLQTRIPLISGSSMPSQQTKKEKHTMDYAG